MGFKAWLAGAKPRLIPYPSDLPLESKTDTKKKRTEHPPKPIRQKPPAPVKPVTQESKPPSSQELLPARSESARLRAAGREPRQQIGQILLRYRLITQAQLEEALSVQAARKEHKLLGEILIELGFLTEIQLISTISKICQIPFIPLEKYAISKEALEVIPFATARRLQLIPLDRLGRMLQIAMANPFDYAAIREIEELTDYTVKRVVVTKSALHDAYVRLASEWEGLGLSKGVSESMEPVVETAHGEDALAEDDAEEIADKPSVPVGIHIGTDTRELPAVEVKKEEKADATWVDEISMLSADELDGELISLQSGSDLQADASTRTTKIVSEEKLDEIVDREIALQEKETTPGPEIPEADKPAPVEEAPPPQVEPSAVSETLDEEIPVMPGPVDEAAEVEELPELLEEAVAPEEVQEVTEKAEEPEAVPADIEAEKEEEIETILAEVELELPVIADLPPMIDLSEPFPDEVAAPAPEKINISALDIEEPDFIKTEEPSLLEEGPTPVSPEEALAMLMATGDEKPQKVKKAPVRPEPTLDAVPISPEQWEILVPKSANQEFQDRIAAFIRRRVMHAVPVSDEEFETVVEIL